jgi:hypothetical protein
MNVINKIKVMKIRRHFSNDEKCFHPKLNEGMYFFLLIQRAIIIKRRINQKITIAVAVNKLNRLNNSVEINTRTEKARRKKMHIYRNGRFNDFKLSTLNLEH